MNYSAALVGGIETFIRHIFVGFDQKDVFNFFPWYVSNKYL